jgi:hypothetical protein
MADRVVVRSAAAAGMTCVGLLGNLDEMSVGTDTSVDAAMRAGMVHLSNIPVEQGRTTMPQYLYQLAYTSESLAAQIKNPEDRLELVGKQLVDAVGAHIVGSGYSFGEHDVSTPSRPACGSPIWHASKPTTSGSPQDRLSGRSVTSSAPTSSSGLA